MIKRFYRVLIAPLDAVLVVLLVLLLSTGLLILHSASDQSATKMQSQLANVAVALVAMWCVARQPLSRVMAFAVPIYLFGIGLLIGVYFFGHTSKGAQRWLQLGPTRIQPSELMKIALPMMLAYYLHRHGSDFRTRTFLISALVLALPVGFVLKQPDLGTAILIFCSGFFVLFLAGLPWSVMIGMGATALLSAPVVWSMLHEYQRQRVFTLFDPTQDPLGKGYHILQGMIAIGSGGLWGKGWLQGTQTRLDYIPERATDFIFAVFSEEFGLAGNLTLLLIYGLLIARGLSIALYASTRFGRLLAGALAMTLFMYAFVNMGMVSGILPVVGVPLPLISYGGTSLVTLCVGCGLLMSIRNQKAMISFA